MYIVEMNEKNIAEAAECYSSSWKSAHSNLFSEEFVNNFTPEKNYKHFKKG